MLTRKKPGNSSLAFVKTPANRLVRGGGGINKNCYRQMVPAHYDGLLIVGPTISSTDYKLEAIPPAQNVVGLDTHVKETERMPSEKFKQPSYEKLSGTVSNSLKDKIYEPQLAPADAAEVKVVQGNPKESETSKLSGEISSSTLKDKYVDPEKQVAPADAIDRSLVGEGDGGADLSLPGGSKKRPIDNYYDLLQKSKAVQKRKKKKLDKIIEDMEFV